MEAHQISTAKKIRTELDLDMPLRKDKRQAIAIGSTSVAYERLLEYDIGKSKLGIENALRQLGENEYVNLASCAM